MHAPYVLSENSSFLSIVKALDARGMGFIAVTDAEGILKGIVTDGDIRRAVLRGTEKLDDVINGKPEVMLDGCSDREIIARLKQINRRNMPIVDGIGRFVRVFSLEGEFVSKKHRVVIMAGGLGTRLGNLTRDTPKPMLHVGAKPMLQHLIEMFSDHGYNQFVICVNYRKEQIKEYFGDGRSMGVQIEYIEESQQLGTAGALGLITEKPTEPFFVINADILTTLDFDALLERHLLESAHATMCVRNFQYQIPYGVIRSDGKGVIDAIEEKPVESFKINAGIYLLDPVAIDYVPEGEFFDMPSLFSKLKRAGFKAMVFEMSDYWIDIGKVEDFEKAKLDLSFFSNSQA